MDTFSGEPISDFLAQLEAYVDHRLDPHIPFRATVTAVSAGLIQIQRQTSIDADTEEYARCGGMVTAPAVGDEVLCMNMNDHPIIVSIIRRDAVDTWIDADWYSDLNSAFAVSDGRPIYVKTPRTQTTQINVPSALQNEFHLIGIGRQGRITYTGAGAFFLIDPTLVPTSGTRRSNWLIENINLVGPGSGVAGTIGFNFNNCLSGTMRDVNIAGFETDLLLDGTAGAVWYNTFINVLCTASINAMVVQQGANSNSFLGGRACNSQYGVQILAPSINTTNNSFFGTDIESNTVYGIVCGGNGNHFFGCRLENPSATNEVKFDDSGTGGHNNFIAGYWSTVNVDTNIDWDVPRANVVFGREFSNIPYMQRLDQATKQVAVNPGAATLTNAGFAASPTLTATATNNDGVEAAFIQHETGAVSGNSSGLISAFDVTRLQWLPDIVFKIKTGTAVSSSRIWVGLFNANPDGTSGTTGDHFAAFRRDTGAGDVNWMLVTNDGGATPTITDTGFVVGTSTVFEMRVKVTAKGVSFYINNKLYGSHTTDLPSASGFLGYGVRITTLSAALRRINWSFVRLSV